ncbi:methyltransferase family protein [Goodfellowiella coeruleoviolacea]|nr:isoprenylcysteine carboxylmethyltransferase family protein [Goodfellowiella coeruleoviolacea]
MFPGVMAVLIPAMLLVTVGRGDGLSLAPGARAVAITAGALLTAFGLALFCWTVVLFAKRGKGTLSPLDAPKRLVVTGPYRHVRNPMYTAVFSVQLGEAVMLWSWTLLLWFGCFAAFVMTFVPLREERWLATQFGADYAEYRAHVPRWLPRPTPWYPGNRV